MARKLTLSEAINELARFKNVFRAAERLEEALQGVVNIEGEVARLRKEIKEAENEKGYILQEITDLEKKRDDLAVQVEKAKDTTPVQIEAESKRIKENLQRVRDELKNTRAAALKEKETLTREIGDLLANKTQLTGQVEKLQANVKDKTSGSEREIKAIQEEKATLTGELNKLRELVEEKKIEAREVGTKEARAAMAGERDRLNRQIADLNAQKLQLTGTVDKLNATVKQLTARVNSEQTV